MADVTKFGSWAQRSRCYEQRKVMDDMNDMNDFGHELRALDVMKNSGLWMTWMTLGWAQRLRCFEQHKVVDDKNNYRSRELRPLDSMNISRLRMIWTILGRELKVLDAMNSLGL